MRKKTALVAHRKPNNRYDVYETEDPIIRFSIADHLREHPPLGPEDGALVAEDPIATDVTLDEMTEPGGPIGYTRYNQLIVVDDEDETVDSYQIKATTQERIEDDSIDSDLTVWNGFARLVPMYSDRTVESVNDEYLNR